MNIFIVESFSKCKKIQSYLGKNWIVKASSGHVYELPKTQIGIDLNSYEPLFVILNDKKHFINDLKREIKNNQNIQVYLATDMDYEGERIAYDLATSLNLKNPIRITFNEITESAILTALENPKQINQNYVDAQTCRRVLDRLIGYQISPVLQKITGIKNASVGRCISVVTKLLYEQENNIINHQFSYIYKCIGNFFINDKLFHTSLNKKFKNKNDLIDFLNNCNLSNNVIRNINKKQVKISPPPPFTTSSLNIASFNMFGFSVKKTTMLLQNMYQNGLITYIRTDSKHISKSFQDNIHHYLKQQGNNYQFRIFQNNTFAQEAHECIRPTDLSFQNISTLSNDEQKIYTMIFKRTIASQMEDTIILKHTFEITTNHEKIYFKGEQDEILNPGWKTLYTTTVNTDNLVSLKDSKPILKNIISTQTYNSPEKRYTEGSLIKKLEQYGIGRPSTYSSIISNIQDKKYAYIGDKVVAELDSEVIDYDGKHINTTIEKISFKDEKCFIITDIGIKITKLLETHFPEIMDYQFTCIIESDLDCIANGLLNWKDVVQKFHNNFKNKLNNYESDRISKSIIGQYKDHNVEILTTRYGPAIKYRNKFWNIENLDITLDDAIEKINNTEYPKSLGYYNNSEIKLHTGPYGNYLKYGGKNYNLAYNKHPTLEESIKIIDKKIKTKK